MQKKEFQLQLENKTITATFTDMADQTNGSVLLRLGDTTVFVTAVMSGKTKEGANFFPLTVDYEEKFYAAGRILGGQYLRREGRPSEEAILSGRVVDRTIRPLFNQKIRNEVQVVVTTLSIDDENDPDVLGILGASLALGTSDIPWAGPVGAVRVCKGSDGSWILNPTHSEREGTTLDLLICGKDGKVNMIEAAGREVSEDEVSAALAYGVEAITTLEAWQAEIIQKIGKKKVECQIPTTHTTLQTLFTDKWRARLQATLFNGEPGKKAIEALREEWLLAVKENSPETTDMLGAGDIFDATIDELIHEGAITENKRPDGRAMDELRPLFAQAGDLSPIVHGVGLFYRGGTHVLSTLTLGGPKDSLLLEGAEVQDRKYFMHHYNFPPFSSGETGRMGGTNRRMIGHGALAERALVATLPSREKFPYTIRLVSESLASNGSTSMASVCASTLALMDGGVPIARPTAGIAMGLMMEQSPDLRAQNSKENQNSESEISNKLQATSYKLLTDIQGPEDEHGDMDFKVAGTREGITAVQMDVKVEGIPLAILREAFAQSKKARLQILDVIEAAIPATRAELKPSAPRIVTFFIKQDQIGGVIGPGGKIIQEITKTTNADITIEQDGKVTIVGRLEGVRKACEIIQGITHEYRAGERFEGIVTRIMDFGAFVSIGPNTEGLVHISELTPFRVNNVRDIVKEGEKVPVVVKEVDERGRINLSIRHADPEFAKKKGIVPPAPVGMPQRPPHHGPPPPPHREAPPPHNNVTPPPPSPEPRQGFLGRLQDKWSGPKE